MKKIIPFKKEVIFKTNIDDIVSISLEHELKINNNNVSGEFIVSGEYKVSDNDVEPFNLNIPFSSIIDEYIDTSEAICDIDDFYYEIVDDKILSISIDVCIDKLKEILIREEIPNLEEKKDIIEELFEDNREEEIIEEKQVNNTLNQENKLNSLFNHINEDEAYISYTVCIIREGDTLESIADKYAIDIEEINKYNNTQDLNIGDKLIIPHKNESN